GPARTGRREPQVLAVDGDAAHVVADAGLRDLELFGVDRHRVLLAGPVEVGHGLRARRADELGDARDRTWAEAVVARTAGEPARRAVTVRERGLHTGDLAFALSGRLPAVVAQRTVDVADEVALGHSVGDDAHDDDRAADRDRDEQREAAAQRRAPPRQRR